MKAFAVWCNFLLCVFLGSSVAHNLVDRLPVATFARRIRSPGEAAHNDCRYEKGPWQACDSANGLQKRTLTLRTARSIAVECPREKFIERPCKKQCKYTKGVWSECTNGSKERLDKLRENVSTSGCKPDRHITKQCKKQCSYEKSEWGPCESGGKAKTLTLMDSPGNSVDCEPVKSITKVCAKGGKAAKRMRKKNREQAEG